MRPTMTQVKVYKEELDDIGIVYIPEMGRLYIVKSSDLKHITSSLNVDKKLVVYQDYDIQHETAVSDIVLLLSDKCNLNCTYCYSNAESGGKDMPPDIAEKTIKYVADCVKSRNEFDFSILFHGAGEPTLNWKTLTYSVDFAKKYALENNLKAHLSLATNGILTPKQLTYISKNIDNVTISLDGPQNINDIQRLDKTGNSFLKEYYIQYLIFTVSLI